MQVHEARLQLKAAVCKSHPPTAQYLVEAAAVCLDNGLQTALQGFTLKPVAWRLVAKAVQTKCPGVLNSSDKLCGSVGQKYFTLLGTSPSGRPELVAAKLDSLITSPNRPAVAQLLARIHKYGSSSQPDPASIARPHVRTTSMTVRATELTSTLHCRLASSGSADIARVYSGYVQHIGRKHC